MIDAPAALAVGARDGRAVIGRIFYSPLQNKDKAAACWTGATAGP